MKKRMLLIIAFGLSFTPAIFAGEIGTSDTPKQAIACNRSQPKPETVKASDEKSTKESSSGRADKI